MKLHVISTGSLGNSYLLKSDSGQTLIIECGVTFTEIKEALNFDYSNCFAVISHRHGDHAKCAKDVAKAGIDIYCEKYTSDSFNFVSHRIKNIEPEKQFTVGEFKILPFRVSHDVECLGFLIGHPEAGKILFLTDSFLCEPTFTGLTNILIEANFCNSILEDRINSSSINQRLSDRILQNHLSLQTCKGILMANDLSKVNNLVLIHLSDFNADGPRFQREIQELTGKNVTVAKAGLELQFNRQPF